MQLCETNLTPCLNRSPPRKFKTFLSRGSKLYLESFKLSCGVNTANLDAFNQRWSQDFQEFETDINRKRNFSLSSACSEDQYSVSIWYYFQLNSLNFQNRSSLFWKSSFISAFHLRLVMKQVGAFVRKPKNLKFFLNTWLKHTKFSLRCKSSKLS